VILDDIENQLKRRVVLKSEAHYVAETLWIAHTYFISELDFSPRLAIWSPEKRCGKTLNLEIVELLSKKARRTSSMSPSVLYRMISLDETTVFLIDESDRIFSKKADKERAEAMTSIINTGFKRGSSVWRCKPNTLEPEEFSTFAPVALAGIGTSSIPDTVQDRALVIEMRRKFPNETIEEFQSDEEEAIFSPLREALDSWSQEIRDQIRPCRPELPNELHSRAKDCWKPLFKIATYAGSDWLEKARKASLELSLNEADDDDKSYSLRLLSDCREVFDCIELGSQALVERLCEIEEAPYGHGDHRLNTASLARNLKTYGIRPTRTNKLRLYRREDFQEAWDRYLPVRLESVTPVTPVTIEDEPDSLW
jgi:hypothetical protein